MVDTGVVADTKEMVGGVVERKKRNPGKHNSLFWQAEELAFRARKAWNSLI